MTICHYESPLAPQPSNYFVILYFCNIHILCFFFPIEQKQNGEVDFQHDGFLSSFSEDELLKSFDLIGTQVSYLWSMFLHFHRFDSSLDFFFGLTAVHLADSVCYSTIFRFSDLFFLFSSYMPLFHI